MESTLVGFFVDEIMKDFFHSLGRMFRLFTVNIGRTWSLSGLSLSLVSL